MSRQTDSPCQRWLTEREVAGLTGISVATLRAHRQKRRGMEYAKIGRSVRYAEFTVIAFMNACTISLNP